MRLPMFIVFFILASILGSVIPLGETLTVSAAWLSKALLVAALFLIGTEISRKTLVAIQGKVLVQALLLWLMVIPSTLFAVLYWVD